jgi:hypothetical protein
MPRRNNNQPSPNEGSICVAGCGAGACPQSRRRLRPGGQGARQPSRGSPPAQGVKYTESEGLARPAMVVDQKKRPDDGQRFCAESLLGARPGRGKNSGEPNSCCPKAIRECRREITASRPPTGTARNVPIRAHSALQELGQARQGGRNRETVRSALEISGVWLGAGPNRVQNDSGLSRPDVAGISVLITFLPSIRTSKSTFRAHFSAGI